MKRVDRVMCLSGSADTYFAIRKVVFSFRGKQSIHVMEEEQTASIPSLLYSSEGGDEGGTQ